MSPHYPGNMKPGNCLFSHAAYQTKWLSLHTALNNTTLLSTKIIEILVDARRRCSKPTQCRFRDTIYSMTENTQFQGFMFMFPQVVHKHYLKEVGQQITI